jgi:hypothetical protein
MKLPRLVLAISTGLVAAVAAVAVVKADKAAVKPAPGGAPERRAAPAQLSAVARATRVKAALKAGGFNLATALSGPRLTPIAPAHTSGAAITYAGPGVFLGADPDEPDGAFLLQHSSVQMRFPTTAQKTYVLTCSFELFGQGTKSVTVKRPGANPASVPLEGGHILHAFQAGGAVTNLNLEVIPPNNFPAAGYFYGCDLGPAS